MSTPQDEEKKDGEKKQRVRCNRGDRCDDFLTSDVSVHPRHIELVLSYTRRNVKPVNVPAANILRALIRRA